MEPLLQRVLRHPPSFSGPSRQDFSKVALKFDHFQHFKIVQNVVLRICTDWVLYNGHLYNNSPDIVVQIHIWPQIILFKHKYEQFRICSNTDWTKHQSSYSDFVQMCLNKMKNVQIHVWTIYFLDTAHLTNFLTQIVGQNVIVQFQFVQIWNWTKSKIRT